MRYLPLFLVLLVLSAPGSVGVIEQSRTIDATKISSELVSILDSGEKIEAKMGVIFAQGEEREQKR